MALNSNTPVLLWFADSLADLDKPTGATKSNPGALTDPALAGTPDSYADFNLSQAVLYALASAVNNVGTGDITIVIKGMLDTATAGRVIAENYDGAGTATTDVGWRIVNTTGTSRRVGLALPPTAYTSQRIESAANAITLDQNYIAAFRRSGTTWTMWLDDDATGGMVAHAPGTNTLPGNASFGACGSVAFGSTIAGANPSDHRIYWLATFNAAVSDPDLQLADWDDEANLKAAWLSGDIGLVVGDATHAHTAESPALSQANTLTVTDALQGHAAESPSLVQGFSLLLDDALHGQLADQVTLTQAHTLAVNDAQHSQAADPVALIQGYVLSVAETLHGHSAESPTLAAGLNLAVQDALHSQSADSPLLVQAHVLAVDDAIQSHVVANVTLQSGFILAVADALQAHSAESPALAQGYVLAIAGALHLHAAGIVDLSQAATLIVSDALHAQLADLLELRLPGVVSPSALFIVQRKRGLFIVSRSHSTFTVH